MYRVIRRSCSGCAKEVFVSQGAQDYAQLLNQCYELERKRQQVIEQFHQYGGWNYQGSSDNSGYGMQWANGPTFQEHSLPVRQASNPTTFCSCCSYVGPCFAAPCTSVAACFFGGSCAGKSCSDAFEARDPWKSSPQEDKNIVETAIGAAERALSSMRAKISGVSNSEGKHNFQTRHSSEMWFMKQISQEMVVIKCLEGFSRKF